MKSPTPEQLAGMGFRLDPIDLGEGVSQYIRECDQYSPEAVTIDPDHGINCQKFVVGPGDSFQLINVHGNGRNCFVPMSEGMANPILPAAKPLEPIPADPVTPPTP